MGGQFENPTWRAGPTSPVGSWSPPNGHGDGTHTMTSDSTSRPPAPIGWIVLAAYRPDEVLFGRQLRSIQQQTVRDFRVAISADGDQDAVRALVSRLTEADERFSVIGADDRLGFYGNFERALQHVPEDAAWVALSDQDDLWDHDKLERMLPSLTEASLVAAQARVVRYPDGTVLSQNTKRRTVSTQDLPVFNQFTGGMSVLRREVLDVALPFPRSASPAQVHDHWLALCAAVDQGAVVSPEIVQDYVQHGANVLGESVDERFRPVAAWKRLRRQARARYGSASFLVVASIAFDVSAGWAETMAEALARRRPDSPAVRRLAALYGPGRSWWRTAGHLASSALKRRIPARNVVVYLVGASLRPVVRQQSSR